MPIIPYPTKKSLSRFFPLPIQYPEAKPKRDVNNPEELFKKLSQDICFYMIMFPDFKTGDLQGFLDGWFAKNRIQILP